jgi:hypothetical protein
MTGWSRQLLWDSIISEGVSTSHVVERCPICSWLEEELDFSFYYWERGYEVFFRDGQVLLFPKGSSITSAKVIGTRHEKLYKIMF